MLYMRNLDKVDEDFLRSLFKSLNDDANRNTLNSGNPSAIKNMMIDIANSINLETYPNARKDQITQELTKDILLLNKAGIELGLNKLDTNDSMSNDPDEGVDLELDQKATMEADTLTNDGGSLTETAREDMSNAHQSLGTGFRLSDYVFEALGREYPSQSYLIVPVTARQLGVRAMLGFKRLLRI